MRLHVFFQEDGPRNGGGADSPDGRYVQGIGAKVHLCGCKRSCRATDRALPGGRKLLVLNTTRPLRIYPLNGEHGSYGAYSEFRYAAGPVEVRWMSV